MSLGDEIEGSVERELFPDYSVNEDALQVLHFEELRNPEQFLSKLEFYLFFAHTRLEGMLCFDDVKETLERGLVEPLGQ